MEKQDILARLVALNRERTDEERRGQVRWLRPDYQIPRFGSEKEKAAQFEADLVGGGVAAAGPRAAKPSFPANEMDQTAAVMAALLAAAGPLDAGAVAACFRQGRRVEPKARAILVALARTGVAVSGDGGRTFAARRAA